MGRSPWRRRQERPAPLQRLAGGGKPSPIPKSDGFLQFRRGRQRLAPPFRGGRAGGRAEGAVEGAERTVAQVEGDGGDGRARLCRIGQPGLGGVDPVAVDEVGEVAVAQALVDQPAQTMLRLAALPNIVGVKDCCADATQSFDLLRDRPEGFSVLTGEDALFYTALTQGADGGILASAHVRPEAFATIREHMSRGDQPGALRAWRALSDLPRLLFAEPRPAPIKYWLWRTGLIDSPELRLPMTQISAGLAARIDREIANFHPREQPAQATIPEPGTRRSAC